MAAFDTMLKLINKENPKPQRMVGDILVRQSTGPIKK